MSRKPFEPTRTPVRAYDPQLEVSEELTCPRCGDLAEVHVHPGYDPEVYCPGCATDDEERPEAQRQSPFGVAFQGLLPVVTSAAEIQGTKRAQATLAAGARVTVEDERRTVHVDYPSETPLAFTFRYHRYSYFGTPETCVGPGCPETPTWATSFNIGPGWNSTTWACRAHTGPGWGRHLLASGERDTVAMLRVLRAAGR